MLPVEAGDTFTETRTFTPADVDRFAAVTGDDQARHTEPDEGGRRMVQGLLTASLLTSIGGDLEVLASQMEFRFRRPVYTGETVVCEMEITAAEPRHDGGASVVGDVTIRRVGQPAESAVGDGSGDANAEADFDDSAAAEVVLEATVEGIIRE
ncbi:MaoC/PaaZ C-terminal domain-containing protein [Haloarcula salina]|uniref:Enoyl-CoA hydratase n=1 Tax=Haloarcula salina TaxID=1429914 RepID=A0AA41G102_9EURY|nr:MaoC/PaaZ C-terminal domain-containing protein [Haloarcula salina]MBV0902405.1 enoyl-CoA hydratase [Haloarcula salina]